jgi:hypothetical protein
MMVRICEKIVFLEMLSSHSSIRILTQFCSCISIVKKQDRRNFEVI